MGDNTEYGLRRNVLSELGNVSAECRIIIPVDISSEKERSDDWICRVTGEIRVFIPPATQGAELGLFVKSEIGSLG